MTKLDHKHLILNADVKKPPTDVKATEDFLRMLVEEIGMKIKVGPFAGYCEAEGNNGITGAVCIETSHISIHAWDKAEKPYLRMDVYSCTTFDVEKVVEIVRATFGATAIDWVVLDRNNAIRMMDSGT